MNYLYLILYLNVYSYAQATTLWPLLQNSINENQCPCDPEQLILSSVHGFQQITLDIIWCSKKLILKQNSQFSSCTITSVDHEKMIWVDNNPDQWHDFHNNALLPSQPKQYKIIYKDYFHSNNTEKNLISFRNHYE